jgi:TonB-dependent SusC/RagA subfamily outer membrane receptor
LSFCLGGNGLYAANPVIVKGVVYDQENFPLAGAAVLVQGTSDGTIADEKGEFSISVQKGQTLIVSFIGFQDKFVEVTDQLTYFITLSEDANILEEIVVVGYDTQKKVNLTGSVSSVSTEQLNNRPIVQSSTALQGIAAGVTVTTGGGEPGADGGSIRIRGLGTFGQSSASPLVLIDGVEGDMNSLDPTTIDKISVLKDAASSAIYGSRAANGVVLITTKRGKEGHSAVTYRGYVGWQTPTMMPENVSAEEYMTLSNEALMTDGSKPLYSKEYIENYESTSEYDTAAIASKKIELNQWLYEAQYTKEYYPICSFYSDEILELEPIK